MKRYNLELYYNNGGDMKESPDGDYVEYDELTTAKFPVMLRQMWSGSEVQAWLDEQGAVVPRKD